MIGYLKGIIKQIGDNYVIIVNTNNVGYRVEVGSKSVKHMEGDEIEFFIHTYVRENELRLFGFETHKELQLFEYLISVNRVGPKVGLQLISELGGEVIISAILGKCPEDLRITGVGIKTAKKIVLELGDTLRKAGFMSDKKKGKDRDIQDVLEEQIDEIKGALDGLGYSSNEINRAIQKLESMENIEKKSSEALVKLLLKHI